MSSVAKTISIALLIISAISIIPPASIGFTVYTAYTATATLVPFAGSLFYFLVFIGARNQIKDLNSELERQKIILKILLPENKNKVPNNIFQNDLAENTTKNQLDDNAQVPQSPQNEPNSNSINIPNSNNSPEAHSLEPKKQSLTPLLQKYLPKPPANDTSTIANQLGKNAKNKKSLDSTPTKVIKVISNNSLNSQNVPKNLSKSQRTSNNQSARNNRFKNWQDMNLQELKKLNSEVRKKYLKLRKQGSKGFSISIYGSSKGSPKFKVSGSPTSNSLPRCKDNGCVLCNTTNIQKNKTDKRRRRTCFHRIESPNTSYH